MHILPKLMIPSGIVAGVLILFVIATGLRWIKVKVKLHRLLGLIGGGLLLIHAAVTVYLTYFR